MIYRTPQPGFTVCTEGQDSKAPFNSRGIHEPVPKNPSKKTDSIGGVFKNQNTSYALNSLTLSSCGCVN